MNSRAYTAILFTVISLLTVTQMRSQESSAYNDLTADESKVIIKKATEYPFTGLYEKFDEKGTYLCKQCGNALYHSDAKFDARCGWPSFDDEIEGAVKRVRDADGMRTEIVCANCGGHLGHVFTGEGFTPKNTRHCVNSISLDFVPVVLPAGQYGTAVFAGGCFWGVEYFMQKAPGVVSVVSGYTGRTGHAEAVKITYDTKKTSYEKLLKLFLEIHDPTQMGRQGPDIGDQYRSGIFYKNKEQKETADKLLGILRDKGLKVATQVTKASEFYPAEDYHQDYYFNNGKTPYCHAYTQRF